MSDPDREALERGELVYDLYTRGYALLESGDFAAATVPLERARKLEPDKTSIREALGRAYFRSGRFEEARREFAAVVEQAPGQRLRPLLPGQGAGQHRPPLRRPPPRRAGRLDAARPGRLPGAARPAARGLSHA